MQVDIDMVFDQIVNIQADQLEDVKLKDIRLDLGEDGEFDSSMGYLESYEYLCECLKIDIADNDRQKFIDLFLVHQYLCRVYLSESTVEDTLNDPDNMKFIVPVIRECFSSYRFIGYFEGCIHEYQILRNSHAWSRFSDIEKISFLKETAKSYRNMGDFKNALNLYYECLKINGERDWLQKVELLLKIGKVYKNYLMQINLARFYVEEARYILTENNVESCTDKKVLRYAVICYDTLGQIYRDNHEVKKAATYFQTSAELHDKIGAQAGRAQAHKILMKYQEADGYEEETLKNDVELLSDYIEHLANHITDEVGIGIRSVQLAQLKYRGKAWSREESYQDIERGRLIANRYNDVKTVIRSYMAEADFYKEEGEFEKYLHTNLTAIKIASGSNQLVLENEIIKETIETVSAMHRIDSTTEVELIKRRKNIYMQLVEFSKLSISIVQENMSEFFSQDKLIEMYRIVLEDFEHIFGELNAIIEILEIELENLNQKYVAYLNTEIQGFTYKSILHKFKNDLPDSDMIDHLIMKLDDAREECLKEYGVMQEPEVFQNINRQLETLKRMITYIKSSASESLKDASSEKTWYGLNGLMENSVQNFIYSRPAYKHCIHFTPTKQTVSIKVQRTLFEATILDILRNAFDYAETVMTPKEIISKFAYDITVEMNEERMLLLVFYSRYLTTERAISAVASMKKGLEQGESTKRDGSGHGFYSMKLLFQDFMGGKVDAFQQQEKAGLRIQLPMNPVILRS